MQPYDGLYRCHRPILGPRFGAPVCDQLIDQAAIRGHIGEQPAQPFGRRPAPLYFGVRGRGGLGHAYDDSGHYAAPIKEP